MRNHGTHIVSEELSETSTNKISYAYRRFKGTLHTWWNKKKFGSVGQNFSAPYWIQVVNGKNIEIGDNVFIGMNCQLYAFPKGKIILGNHVSLDRFVEIRGGKKIEVGNNVRIVKGSTLKASDSSEMIIGARTIISQNCIFDGNISIGEDVIFGPQVFMNEGEHGFADRSIPMNQQLGRSGSITIENDVWIGYGAVVLKGVHIERGAVIGANAVINKSIAGYTINAGVPCRMIRERT